MTQYTKVVVNRGAVIGELINPIITYVEEELPDAVYVLAGINDCTVLNRESYTVSLVSTDPMDIADMLEMRYRQLITSVRAEVPGVPLVICSLYGIELNTYNRGLPMTFTNINT